MKGRKWLVWMLALGLLAWCCGAMAEDWPPKGKTEAASSFGIEELNETVYSRSAYSLDGNERVGTTVMLSGTDGAEEEATSVQITFLSGDEALKGLYSHEKFAPSTIWVNPPKEGLSGEASFRIRAESKSFYLEKEVHPKVSILDPAGMNLDAIIYRVEIGKDTELIQEVASVLYSRNLLAYSLSIEINGSRVEETDEYLLNYFNFTARQEGDWWLDIGAGIDWGGTTIHVPLILHTGETLQPETVSRLEEYRNTNGIRAENEGTQDPETMTGTEDVQKIAEAGTGEPEDAAAGENGTPAETAEAVKEEPQDAATAENGTAPESAEAEEEEPRIKPVAEDPHGENWAEYISEKVLPALEPALTKETYTSTLLPLHGEQGSTVTYGTRFRFSRPEEDAILGSMLVHYAGNGNGQGYQNTPAHFVYRHFFILYLSCTYFIYNQICDSFCHSIQ